MLKCAPGRLAEIMAPLLDGYLDTLLEQLARTLMSKRSKDIEAAHFCLKCVVVRVGLSTTVSPCPGDLQRANF